MEAGGEGIVTGLSIDFLLKMRYNTNSMCFKGVFLYAKLEGYYFKSLLSFVSIV